MKGIVFILYLNFFKNEEQTPSHHLLYFSFLYLWHMRCKHIVSIRVLSQGLSNRTLTKTPTHTKCVGACLRGNNWSKWQYLNFLRSLRLIFLSEREISILIFKIKQTTTACLELGTSNSSILLFFKLLYYINATEPGCLFVFKLNSSHNLSSLPFL